MSVFVCKGLKSSGKLCLILDLDHTLVHVCSPSAEQAKNGVTGTSLLFQILQSIHFQSYRKIILLSFSISTGAPFLHASVLNNFATVSRSRLGHRRRTYGYC